MRRAGIQAWEFALISMIGIGAGCYTFIPQFEKMKADAEALEKKRQDKLKMMREGAPEG